MARFSAIIGCEILLLCLQLSFAKGHYHHDNRFGSNGFVGGPRPGEYRPGHRTHHPTVYSGSHRPSSGYPHRSHASPHVHVGSFYPKPKSNTCGKIKTEEYFKSALDIPMKLYDNFVCAVFKKPPAYPETMTNFPSVETVLKYFAQDIEDIKSGYHRTLFHLYGEGYLQYAKRTIKAKLYGGMDHHEAQKLKKAMLKHLNVKDLENILCSVYWDKEKFAKEAEQQLSVFYVKSSQSTIDKLSHNDRRHILADLILAANRKLVCPTCHPSFTSAEQVVNTVSEKLLYKRVSKEKKAKALEAMKFISEAKLTSTKVSSLLGKLVNSYSAGSLDREMTCRVLFQAKVTSYYCGVRETASQLYDKLGCCRIPHGRKKHHRTVKPDTDADDDDALTGSSSEDTFDHLEDGNDESGAMSAPIIPEETTTTSTTTTPAPTTTTTTTTTTTETTTTKTTTETTTTPAKTTKAAAVTAPQCGVSDLASRMFTVQTEGLLTEARIVGGFVAGTCTTYPWMVRILIPNTGNTCGGAILDSRHILTASHCLLFTDKIKVFVGDYDRANVEGTEQVIEATIDETNNKALHPDYNFGRRVNDIAVVTLDTPINLDEICATPICLDPTFEIKKDMKCTTAGWGLTDENARTGSELMMAVSMPTFDSEDCLSLFPDIFMSDPKTQVCAGEPDVGGVDSCGGDSGSPLFCLDDAANRWVAVGVVNYGDGCARAGFAGVYSDVRKYIPWIISRMAD